MQAINVHCALGNLIQEDDPVFITPKLCLNFQLVVGKCCEVESILVEVSLGHRECRPRSDIHGGGVNSNNLTGTTDTEAASSSQSSSVRWWSPIFFDLEKDAEVPRPATYELKAGLPTCDYDDLGEVLFAAYHHDNTFDNLVRCTWQ